MWNQLKQIPLDMFKFGASVYETPKVLRTGKPTNRTYNTPFGKTASFQTDFANIQNDVLANRRRARELMNPIAGTVATGAGLLGGGIAGRKAAMKEAENITRDILFRKKLIKVPWTEAVTHEPVPGVFAPKGVQQMVKLDRPRIRWGHLQIPIELPHKSITGKTINFLRNALR